MRGNFMKMKKKYLQKIMLFMAYSIITSSSVIMRGCPTCIGYPAGNKAFFEEQESKNENKSTTDQTEHITAAITNDSQEDNS